MYSVQPRHQTGGGVAIVDAKGQHAQRRGQHRSPRLFGTGLQVVTLPLRQRSDLRRIAAGGHRRGRVPTDAPRPIGVRGILRHAAAGAPDAEQQRMRLHCGRLVRHVDARVSAHPVIPGPERLIRAARASRCRDRRHRIAVDVDTRAVRLVRRGRLRRCSSVELAVLDHDLDERADCRECMNIDHRFERGISTDRHAIPAADHALVGPPDLFRRTKAADRCRAQRPA